MCIPLVIALQGVDRSQLTCGSIYKDDFQLSIILEESGNPFSVNKILLLSHLCITQIPTVFNPMTLNALYVFLRYLLPDQNNLNIIFLAEQTTRKKEKRKKTLVKTIFWYDTGKVLFI